MRLTLSFLFTFSVRIYLGLVIWLHSVDWYRHPCAKYHPCAIQTTSLCTSIILAPTSLAPLRQYFRGTKRPTLLRRLARYTYANCWVVPAPIRSPFRFGWFSPLRRSIDSLAPIKIISVQSLHHVLDWLCFRPPCAAIAAQSDWTDNSCSSHSFPLVSQGFRSFCALRVKWMLRVVVLLTHDYSRIFLKKH